MKDANLHTSNKDVTRRASIAAKWMFSIAFVMISAFLVVWMMHGHFMETFGAKMSATYFMGDAISFLLTVAVCTFIPYEMFVNGIVIHDRGIDIARTGSGKGATWRMICGVLLMIGGVAAMLFFVFVAPDMFVWWMESLPGWNELSENPTGKAFENLAFARFVAFVAPIVAVMVKFFWDD